MYLRRAEEGTGYCAAVLPPGRRHGEHHRAGFIPGLAAISGRAGGLRSPCTDTPGKRGRSRFRSPRYGLWARAPFPRCGSRVSLSRINRASTLSLSIVSNNILICNELKTSRPCLLILFSPTYTTDSDTIAVRAAACRHVGMSAVHLVCLSCLSRSMHRPQAAGHRPQTRLRSRYVGVGDGPVFIYIIYEHPLDSAIAVCWCTVHIR